MIIDIHCHHTFTGLRAALPERFSFEPPPSPPMADPQRPPLPTDYDSCVSPRALNRRPWRLARWWLGLPAPGPQLDAELADRYEHQLAAPGPIDRYVLLAFDAVCDDAGRIAPLPIRRRDFGSDIYSSNSLTRELCRRHPTRYLFGASVHPYRPDAVACVDEVFAAGACLLKWIPLHHNIDCTDPRTLAVLRRCAALGLPVLIHCGAEYSLTTHRPALRAVGPLLDTLRRLRAEGAMPTVIVAHAATPVMPCGDTGPHRELLAALAGDLADAPLYADVSALAALTKVRFLRALLHRPDLHHKLLFGSDFPVPIGLQPLRRDLGRDYRRLAAQPGWPQRVAAAYRHLGFNEIVFHRAAELLPHVDYFAARPASPTA